ncbi:MAG: ATP-dependent RecD-like DNA helicase [Defluviitaleaceae bacterium]|nr:ATP-dependent RecD-like DNA helicase [Defluviitaleaceae bacterium]
MENLQIIESRVERVIFASSETGYCVFSVTTKSDEGEFAEVVCTAQILVAEGEDVKLHGEYVVHPQYGQQFKTLMVEKVLPTNEAGMEKYLASGNIKGIGEKRAKQIVEKFGLAAFEVLETNPILLSQIKGISTEKALAMGAEFAAKSGQRNTMMFLQSLGLTSSQCEKVYKKYGFEAVARVKENPYILVRDIFGIGFKIADNIALRAGITHNSPYRISAGVAHTLSEALNEGHVFLPRDNVLARSISLLELDIGEIQNHLLQMQLDYEIKQEKVNNEVVIYLAAYYHAEVYSARKLVELNKPATFDDLDIEVEIEKYENEWDIKLADMQKIAVQKTMERGVVVVTGGPGTGKTTTIKAIIHILQKQGQSITLCAPTGRAAKRMSEATGMEAKTIHRLLGLFQAEGNQNVSGDVDEDMKLDTNCIIVDEASMVDIMLLFRLLKYIRRGTRLVLVGDVNQLPSVGPGNVLKDTINSGVIEPVYLDYIFRQGQQSAIVMNAHRINNGTHPILNEKANDFFFVKEHNIESCVRVIADLATRRLPSFTGVNPMEVQVLCPQRKTSCGVENLNKVLQNTLNPPSEHKAEKQMGFYSFREGDKVMQIKNNYMTEWKIYDRKGNEIDEGAGIFNGDEGVIKVIDNENRIVRVAFYDDKVVDYEFKQLEELVLAYAITIHKSQGSEYDVVILPIHSGTPLLYNRNLLYTAITRAKKLVVIVGIEGTVQRMVDNIRENVRYSALSQRLGEFNERFADERFAQQDIGRALSDNLSE